MKNGSYVLIFAIGKSDNVTDLTDIKSCEARLICAIIESFSYSTLTGTLRDYLLGQAEIPALSGGTTCQVTALQP